MTLGNLFILGIVPKLWLRKILASLVGLVAAYLLILYNRETTFLLALFFAAFVYKTLQKTTNAQNPFSSQEDNFYVDSSSDNVQFNRATQQDSLELDSLVVGQCIAGLFCACLVIFTDWQDFLFKALFACVLIRLYDYYKPSIMSKLYTFEKDRILGFVLGSVLNGILSGLSVAICMVLLDKVLQIVL
ncbi:hypothetical protein CQA66_00665 [Helicobacter aurati]|uniref:Uncharacterized protein n=2 Tax=Helicobacter aurati TaxID=137778 RepID=A0A3D8J8W6_9HELI|nr:hypothetical protein CQA66_00665 [Helicobacter aurati]